MDRPVRIDHIVILLAYQDVVYPPSWLISAFTLTPGGTHADGKTCNRLAIFKDGSYLEFIAFINDDPANREDHWWRDKPIGFADYAFTTSGVEEEKVLRNRLVGGLPGLYDSPRDGGRDRDDGQKVKWKVTFPAHECGFKRGELPFFCHDVTERTLRVPLEDDNTTHPCGAQGIAHVTLLVPKGKLVKYIQTYEKVLGSQRVTDPLGSTRLQVGRSVEIDGMRKDPWLFIEELEIQDEIEQVGEIGATIAKTALDVPADGGIGFARPALRENNIYIQFLKC